jgi:hypothetical protein
MPALGAERKPPHDGMIMKLAGRGSRGLWRSIVMMKSGFLATMVAMLVIGCASVHTDQQPRPIALSPAMPLPFRGRLVQGDPKELPPSVEKSLTDTSPITFLYREELTHDEYHIPLAVTAFDPATYFGVPLGDYGVTAFASLTILDGDRVLGDYTAKTRVSRSYTIYSEPTHAEVEHQARDAVRQKIDDQLSRDATKLAQEASSPPPALGR